MTSNFQNKTAIITGASNGIGMEIGKKFLQAGANVVFSDYAKFDLESLISGISSKVGNAHSFYGNLQDRLTVNNLIATTINEFGRVDMLVNANRTIIPSSPLDEKQGALEKSLSQNLCRETFHTAFYPSRTDRSAACTLGTRPIAHHSTQSGT